MENGKQEFSTPQEALAHYGVKGMHWGVRKKSSSSSDPRDAPHPKYTARMRQNDARQYGKGRVKQINRDMNSGMSRHDAVRKAAAHNRKVTLIGGTAALAGYYIGPSVMRATTSYIHGKAETNRSNAGKQAANAALKQLGELGLKAAKKKSGAYKITGL